MQWCYALLVFVCCVTLAAVEQFLYCRNLAQSGQLHDIVLNRQSRSLLAHFLELDMLFFDRMPVERGRRRCGGHGGVRAEG